MLLVRDIAAAVTAIGGWPLEYFCARTFVIGDSNTHLCDRNDPDEGWVNVRDEPLPPDAEVHGEFLTVFGVSSAAHGAFARARLVEQDSLAAVEKVLLACAVRSPFVLPFVAGRLRDYEVRDVAGRLVRKHGVGVREDEWQEIDLRTCRVLWTGD